MKELFIIIFIVLFSSNLFAEFRMERVICTTKKTSNCGAYIYNSKTGEVYFCDSEKCKELNTPIEILIFEDEEEIVTDKEKKKSLIPKKPKKEKKKSLIPKKPKKKESKVPRKPKKEG